MKIEVGKYYRDASGNKVGPMSGDNFKWVEGYDTGLDPEWTNEGAGSLGGLDLIAEWTDENNGPDTLDNLDLKVGDVVEWNGSEYVAFEEPKPASAGNCWAGSEYNWISSGAKNCTVVSRASQTPKSFGELSPEEKGALLLAHHEGKRIEVKYSDGSWNTRASDKWHEGDIFRIVPARVTGTCEVDANGEPITDTFEVGE